MFLVSILTALADADALVALFPFNRYMLSVPNFSGFLVIECLFERISGNTKLVYQYSITASCRCQVSREVLGFIISGQYGSASGKAPSNVSMSNKQVRHILGLGGKIAQP